MYNFNSRIRYSEVDETGRLRLEALLDYFQDCSTFHSEDIGLGVEYLQTQNLVWVMSSWQIVAKRYPKFGETVLVGTMPYDFKGFVGYRNFLMKDEDGNDIACANTIWSLLDTRTGRPTKPPAEMLVKYELEPRLAMDYAPRRISLPENMTQGVPVEITSRYLDTNHHVNNGQFIRIALEGIEKKGQIRQLRAEYKKQAVRGEVLVPYMASLKDGGHVVVLKNEENVICCIVELQEERK